MQHIHSHITESAVMHLTGLIEDRTARCGGEYDPVLDDLEREFAELRCQFGNA